MTFGDWFPAVWPLKPDMSDASDELGGWDILRSLISNSQTFGGVIVDLDSLGSKELVGLLAANQALTVRVVVAVYAGSPTDSTTLEDLLKLQHANGGRVQFRLLKLPFGQPPPCTTVYFSGEQRVLLTGPSGNMGVREGQVGHANLAFSPDATLVDKWGLWFSSVWSTALPLAHHHVEVPVLNFEVDGRALDLWQDYLNGLDSAHQLGRPPATPEAPMVDPVTGSQADIFHPVVQAKPIVAHELGIVAMTELDRRLASLYRKGLQVSVQQSSRVPPLDMAIKPEHLGVERVKRAGAMRREISYRISAFSRDELEDLEKRRKGTARLLQIMSFPLGEGIRWMPERTFPLFLEELERSEREASNRLADLTGGNAAAFVESKRQEIGSNATVLYREFHPGEHIPDELLNSILGDLTQRLQVSSKGRMLPSVVRNSVGFSPEASTSVSPYSQAYELVYSIAMFRREVVQKPLLLQGLKVDQSEVLASLNVCNDHIFSRSYREVHRIALAETNFLKAINSSSVDDRERIQLVFGVLDGEDSEKLASKFSDLVQQTETVLHQGAS